MFAKGTSSPRKSAAHPLLPVGAVRQENGKDVVYRVDGGKVVAQPVKLGLRNEDEGLVEALDGIDAGATVLAVPLDGVKPASKVKLPVAATAADEAKPPRRKAEAMWMTRVSIKHPVFATMVMVGLMVLGLFSYRGLGVESMPNVEIPAPGSSPVSGRLARTGRERRHPADRGSGNTVSGIKTIRSSSWEGRSRRLASNSSSPPTWTAPMQDLRDKIGARARQLPARGQGTLRHPRRGRERSSRCCWCRSPRTNAACATCRRWPSR
jgi:hypothetical protein